MKSLLSENNRNFAGEFECNFENMQISLKQILDSSVAFFLAAAFDVSNAHSSDVCGVPK